MLPALSTPSCRLSNTSFARRLLVWWEQHGRQQLPWQLVGTAYGFWVAEVMLQQTQVTTVIPYFHKFMRSFPELPVLARAHPDEVLAHWSGLGYYSRARNLHKAANICVEQYNGQLPDNPEQLEALPGIGRSTANAIISQSADAILPILDGNVKRVLTRHAGIYGWPGQSKVARQLWELAEQRLPDSDGANYTQASMDLGAMLCTRTRPKCGQCPVSADCFALHNDQLGELPGKKPKLNRPEQPLDVLIIRDTENRLLLQRRPPAGIWGGLWCLPEGRPDDPANAEAWPAVRHELTHRSMLITAWLMHDTGQPGVGDTQQQQWFTINQALALGLPQPMRRLIERLDEQHG